MELAHQRITRLQHLDIKIARDGGELLRVHPVHKLVHQRAPCPETILFFTRGTFGQACHAALKGVGMQVGHAGDNAVVICSSGCRRVQLYLRKHAAFIDMQAHMLAPCLADEGMAGGDDALGFWLHGAALPLSLKSMTTNWDSIWTHAHLATMEVDAQGKPITIADGAVAVKDGRIAWVGRMHDLLPAAISTAGEVHDLQGRWMTPGFIDCHTHLVYGGNRAKEFEMRLAGVSYADIAKAGGGILSTVKATREASEDALFTSASHRLEQLIADGVTTVEIKSGYGLDLENERKMLRVAQRLGEVYPVSVHKTFLGAHALPPEYAGRADDYITHLCEKMLPALESEDLVDAVDGFCETIGFSRTQMRRLFEVAQELMLPVKLHAEQLSDQSGAALVAEFGGLSADHVEYVSEVDVKAMAEADVIAVLLPAAFYYLKETTKPPVALFRKHGVKMAVASDANPGTAPVNRLLPVVNMACVLFGLTVEEALLAVTAHAAQALGVAGEIGRLQVGMQADFAVWNITELAELAYWTGVSPCAFTVKAGKRSGNNLRN